LKAQKKIRFIDLHFVQLNGRAKAMLSHDMF